MRARALQPAQPCWTSFRTRLLAEHGAAACATGRQRNFTHPFNEVDHALICGMQFMCSAPKHDCAHAVELLRQGLVLGQPDDTNVASVVRTNAISHDLC